MKKYLKAVVSGLCAAALALGCVGCGSSAQDAKTTQVTNITVWTYYNGDQLECFTDLVDKFNETVEQRIAEGQSAADAEAEFLTDDHFEAWYQDICSQLKQYEG